MNSLQLSATFLTPLLSLGCHRPRPCVRTGSTDRQLSLQCSGLLRSMGFRSSLVFKVGGKPDPQFLLLWITLKAAERNSHAGCQLTLVPGLRTCIGRGQWGILCSPVLKGSHQFQLIILDVPDKFLTPHPQVIALPISPATGTSRINGTVYVSLQTFRTPPSTLLPQRVTPLSFWGLLFLVLFPLSSTPGTLPLCSLWSVSKILYILSLFPENSPSY